MYSASEARRTRFVALVCASPTFLESSGRFDVAGFPPNGSHGSILRFSTLKKNEKALAPGKRVKKTVFVFPTSETSSAWWASLGDTYQPSIMHYLLSIIPGTY